MTIVRPCPDSSTCPDDSPIDNYSSEASDSIDYISTFFAGKSPPPLLQEWSATECGITFVSTISQLDADLQAKAAAILCQFQKQFPTAPLILNNPQTCCVPCPDGTQSCYTVPGGLIAGLTQASVDALAFEIACDLVSKNKVCLGNIPGCVCVGDIYSATITSTIPVSWSFSGGSLPPGMTFQPQSNLSATISGSSNIPGQFVFSITGQTSEGPTVTKIFTITVIKITTTSLPPYTIGVPYSFQLQATGGSGNYAWKITNGSLPNGLTMSLTGLISGTPM